MHPQRSPMNLFRMEAADTPTKQYDFEDYDLEDKKVIVIYNFICEIQQEYKY